MVEVLEQLQEELMKIILAADIPSKRFRSCSSAYQCICKAPLSVQGHAFGWFLDKAKWEWFIRPNHEKAIDRAKALMQLLDDEEASPDSVNDLLKELRLDSDGMKRDIMEPKEAYSSPISDSLSSCEARFGKLIAGVIDLYTNDGETSDEYYSKLWDTLSFLLAPYSEVEQGICLFFVLRDKRIPYLNIAPGLRMSEEEYQTITMQISNQLQKLSYVLNLSVGQRTETSSQVLQIMDELDSYKKRTVFLSHLMAQKESLDD